MGAVVFGFALLMTGTAWSRQLDLTKEKIASYFKFDVGTAAEGSDLFAKSSGAQTSFSKSVPVNLNGEIGFLFTGPQGGVRLGVQILDPLAVSGASGANAAGASLMSVDSTIFAWGPALHIESYFGVSPVKKYIFSIGASYLSVTTTNVYKLTPAGQATYPGIADYTETGSTSGFDFDASLAWEISFSEASTFTFEGGYRYVSLGLLKSKGATAGFTGTVPDGFSLPNQDGTSRGLNLSGPFAGIGFRFYFKN